MDILKKKKKVSRKIPSNKVVIHSPYQLGQDEINTIIKNFQAEKDLQVENIVDKNIIAGVVVYKGTEMFDLSLQGGLQNLKQYIYESS